MRAELGSLPCLLPFGAGWLPLPVGPLKQGRVAEQEQVQVRHKNCNPTCPKRWISSSVDEKNPDRQMPSVTAPSTRQASWRSRYRTWTRSAGCWWSRLVCRISVPEQWLELFKALESERLSLFPLKANVSMLPGRKRDAWYRKGVVEKGW